METKQKTTNFSQSFLRWAGSKRQLIPVLSRYWNDSFERYVEPFVGSACLFFSLSPKKAILSDINQELITTYKEITKDVDSVLRELKRLKKTEKDYYRIRSIKPETLDLNKRAARFIYLNRYCFNGLYRTNSKGEFNVPYCGDGRGVMPPNEMFINASKLLKKAQLYANSYEETLKKVKSGDFVYMDPPYSVLSKHIFNKYDKSIFDKSDIIQIRKWMEIFDKNGIRFVVSYAESDEADLLKKGFNCQTANVRRSIAGFINKREPAKEVIITNIK